MSRSILIAMLVLATVVACDRGEPPPPPARPASGPAAQAPAAQTSAAQTPTATTRPSPPRVRTGEFEVIEVDLGTALGSDGRIAQPSTRLASSETIHAVVHTDGRATDVAMTARWTHTRGQLGQLLDQTTQKISPEGPAVTTFRITKAGGWPAGNYRVEITTNGTMAVSKDFVVE